jgi:hypothetical protein
MLKRNWTQMTPIRADKEDEGCSSMTRQMIKGELRCSSFGF